MSSARRSSTSRRRTALAWRSIPARSVLSSSSTPSATITPLIGCFGTVALQLLEQAAPARAVGRSVRILAGVAARGIDDRGLVGEPEIEVAGAADALERLVGERKAQARIEQRGGLARSRRADDDVPRPAVEIVALSARGGLELADRLAHPLADDRVLLRPAGAGELVGDRIVGGLGGAAAQERGDRPRPAGSARRARRATAVVATAGSTIGSPKKTRIAAASADRPVTRVQLPSSLFMPHLPSCSAAA